MTLLTSLYESLVGSLAANWVLIPVAIVLIAFLILVYRVTLHPLAKFPGPFAAKLSGFYRERLFWRGTWHEDIVALHEKYGAVVR